MLTEQICRYILKAQRKCSKGVGKAAPKRAKNATKTAFFMSKTAVFMV